MKRFAVAILAILILLGAFVGCSEKKPKQPDDTTVTGEIGETTAVVTDDMTDAVEETTAETTDAVTEETTAVIVDNEPKPINPFFPEDFVYPGTDGSTSTTNLEKAIKQAIFGGEPTVKHSKTYQAFNNLINYSFFYNLIFTTPLSNAQIQQMAEKGYEYEAEPIAGEGFVFVVNKNNPVNELTVEQLKGIYSGKITNWSQVGGNDAEIIAYQRNEDSGSQNYMISFMGDTELMAPNTDTLPGSMGQILDVVANYDNGINAIGYSVYSYSDGMYENISEIKYVKVNGVEPSIKTLVDGTYPLLGFNYAVFSATEPEDSDVRLLVKWIQSDEGQQVVANAGYVPYRKVEGLTMPDPTSKKLYTAEATSGIKKPDIDADYYYQAFLNEDLNRKFYETATEIPYDCDIFLSETLNKKVSDFIKNASAELSKYDEEKYLSYIETLNKSYESMFGYNLNFGANKTFRFCIRKTLENGYLSVLVAIAYLDGTQDGECYYYDIRTAVFDIYTEEQLEFSDLFFDGVDFVPILNNYLAAESLVPYSGFGTTYGMKRDFSGLCRDNFTFTANSIIFGKNSDFLCDGVELSLDGLSEYMVTSVPRDMSGYVNEEAVSVRRNIKIANESQAERKDTVEIWYLKKGNPFTSDELCDKVNAFAENLYKSYYTREKLEEKAKNNGFNPIYIYVESPAVHSSFDIIVMGRRYIEFSCCNYTLIEEIGAPNDYIDGFTIVDGIDEHYLNYYFDTETGEELKLDNDALFLPGWEDVAIYYYGDGFYKYDNTTWVEYNKSFDIGKCTIKLIEHYDTPSQYETYRELKNLVRVDVETDYGTEVEIFIPREFIR